MSVMIFEVRSDHRMHSYFVRRSSEVARLLVGHDYGSVNSKRAHPPRHLSFCCGKAAMPHGGGSWFTAISKMVVGKSARDNPERYRGWF